MATKKASPKKTTSPSKAKATSTKTKKVQNSANATTEKGKSEPVKKIGPHRLRPDFLKKNVDLYVVSTDDYRKTIEDYNEKFRTDWNPWRCQPQVFYTIHSELLKYYDDKAAAEDGNN